MQEEIGLLLSATDPQVDKALTGHAPSVEFGASSDTPAATDTIAAIRNSSNSILARFDRLISNQMNSIKLLCQLARRLSVVDAKFACARYLSCADAVVVDTSNIHDVVSTDESEKAAKTASCAYLVGSTITSALTSERLAHTAASASAKIR
ncbi:unnamed protein product [Protopolystoma xenopodis]|uniref:Uncharacterized protein n=1 Tax=Protopolystoma xenopodis TaxID=117903 RepID=A0A3S5FGZ4_9PLAT|nr:unnamed protein product [Protopolystoma xenopodis]